MGSACSCALAGTTTCEVCKNHTKCPGTYIVAPYQTYRDFGLTGKSTVSKAEIYKAIRETFETTAECSNDKEFLTKLSRYIIDLMEEIALL